MAGKLHKHKILLDENFYVRSYLPRLNKKFTVKHAVQDFKHAGWPDWEVFQFASKNRMILVTFNVKDFVDFIDLSHTTGIVGVSTNLNDDDIDKKLTSLFTKSSKNSLLGKLTYISGETESGKD